MQTVFVRDTLRNNLLVWFTAILTYLAVPPFHIIIVSHIRFEHLSSTYKSLRVACSVSPQKESCFCGHKITFCVLWRDWCLTVSPLYPLCHCSRDSPYCYCCCCRCCVGATSFYLYRLLCVIFAAGVLLLCYVVATEVLLFPAIPPPGATPPYTTRFSDISSSFRQTSDCADILTLCVL